MADYRAMNRNSKIVDARKKLAATFSTPTHGGHAGTVTTPNPVAGAGTNFLEQMAKRYTVNTLKGIKDVAVGTVKNNKSGLQNNSLYDPNSFFGKALAAAGPMGTAMNYVAGNALNNNAFNDAIAPTDFVGAGSLVKLGASGVLKAAKVAKPLVPVLTSKVGKAASAASAAIAASGFGLFNSDDAQAGVPGAGAVGVGAGARALQGVVKAGGPLERFAKEFVRSQYVQNVLASGRNVNVSGLIPKDILEQGFGTAAAKSVEGLDAFKNLGSKLENKILIEGVIPQANETKASVNATIASGRKRFTDSAGPEVMKAFGINTGRFTKFDYGKPLDALHNLWQKDFPDATSGARVLGTNAAELMAGAEGVIPNANNWKNIGRQFDHFKSPTDAGLYLKAIFENQKGVISDVDKRMAQTLWDKVHHPDNISGTPQEINLGMGGIPKSLLSSTKEVTSRLGKDVGGLMADSSAYVQSRIPLHETHWDEPALRGFNEWHSSSEAVKGQISRLDKKLRGFF